MARRKRQQRYSPEFKAEALRLIAETDEPIKKIARALGVAAKTCMAGGRRHAPSRVSR